MKGEIVKTSKERPFFNLHIFIFKNSKMYKKSK